MILLHFKIIKERVLVPLQITLPVIKDNLNNNIYYIIMNKVKYIKNELDYKNKLLIDNSSFIFHPVYEKYIYNKEKNIYNFGYKVINEEHIFNDFFENSIKYNDYINIINILNKLFIDSNMEVGGAVNSKPIMKRLKQNIIFNNSKLLEHLYSKLIPYIEKKIFNSNIKIIDINAYKNIIHNEKAVSSWLWHIDNHPNEMIKMMIYLTDVNEESSPMEIIIDENNNPIKIISNRVFINDWNKPDNKYFEGQYNGNRLSDNDIKNIQNNGYKIKPLYGKKGTIILFSENIIHRATYPKKRERNIINTVLAPSNTTNIKVTNNTLNNPKRYMWFL